MYTKHTVRKLCCMPPVLAARYVMICTQQPVIAQCQALFHGMLKHLPAYILVQKESEVVVQQLQAHFQVLALS